MLQPSHRKFCCPCKTPDKIGSHSEFNNTTKRVSHKAAGLVIPQRCRMAPCQTHTPMAPTSHKAVVPIHTNRIIPASSRRRLVARALAVWWAIAICRGMP